MKSITVIWKDYRNYDTDCTEERTLYVNGHGEGLFVRDESGGYSQWLGTGQFSARTPREMMRRLRHHYEDQVVRMVRGSADGWD